MRKRGAVLVVAGPSGSGKSTLIQKLLAADRQLKWSISWTTRARRPGEREGHDYHFVSRPQFLAAIRKGRFLEYAVVHGTDYYGTDRQWIERERKQGHDILIEVDLQGARSIRGRMANEAAFVFVVPPSFAVLRGRLKRRHTETQEQIARRLATAKVELAAAAEFDYLVTNDRLIPALDDLKAILRAERCRIGKKA